MLFKKPWLLRGAVAAGVCASVAVGAGVGSAKQAPRAKADHGYAYFSITHSQGGYQYAAGQGGDKVLGSVAFTYRVKLAPGKTGTIDLRVTPVTLYAWNGTLSGTATAVEDLATGAITDGRISLTRGTGGERGHVFKGTFAGRADLAANQFEYTYKGIYR
jgi:hypothetical protein